MTKMKKLIGSSLLGLAVIGGATSVGVSAASADAGHDGPGVAQPHKLAPKTNGENPNWRPGPVQHGGKHYQPIWDSGKAHWGFWVGPVWVPVG